MLGLLSDVAVALAREKPLLLVVDDLQWCDDLSAAFLELLAGDLCARERLVVVATCRSEETTPAIERIRRAPATRAFRLERLDRIALAEMVSDMLAVPQAPPDLTSSLWEVSAGNPFFVTEYLRALIGEKLLVRNRASWHAAGPTVSFGRLPLPHSIHELIQRRLAGLEGASVQVLEVAAVIGRDMDLRLLTSAATAATGDAFKVELGIHILIERQILEESTGNRLRFIHGKIRDEAYRAVAEPRAREIHRDVAALLERWPDRPGDFEAEAAVIGRHYAVAGEISRAIPHLHSAADHAREVHANEGAIALYDETLDLLRHQQKGDTPLAASLLESKADLLALVGRRGERARAMKPRFSNRLTRLQPTPPDGSGRWERPGSASTGTPRRCSSTRAPSRAWAKCPGHCARPVVAGVARCAGRPHLEEPLLVGAARSDGAGHRSCKRTGRPLGITIAARGLLSVIDLVERAQGTLSIERADRTARPLGDAGSAAGW